MKQLYSAWCWALLAAPGLAAAAPRPALGPRAVPVSATLEFIENKGQWDARARYAAAVPGGRLFLENAALTYLFVDPAVLRRHGDAPAAGKGAAPAPARHDQLAAHAYTVHFEGASRQARPVAEGPTGEVRNYFHGKDPSHWARQVGGFRRVRYAGLWPGIDAAVYENAGQHLEYDFVLAPGADAGRVALRYEGAQAVTLDAATGDLTIATAVGHVTEQAPQAWQTDAAGQRQAVACRYALAGGTVHFALGPYDHARALTIDPTVIFSSFTGSLADNWGFTATYDQAGNMYSGGIAFGPGYPATRGAFQTTFSGVCDVALIKYNTQATGPAARVWATYLGGSSSDFPHSLVTNAQNELVVLGSTSSADFPTTPGALSRKFGGGPRLDPFLDGDPYTLPNGADLFVARLSADGTALLASTFLGGSANDGVQENDASSAATQHLPANYGDVFRSDVLLDGAGNVYVAANTASANFPGLSAGFNGTYRGGASDAVVCKLPPGLSAVTWAGLLGGSGADAAYSVQRDDQGRVYVCGGTRSPNFPTTAGAYLAARPGGVDGFAARISADGRALERATYVGTAGYDQAQFLQLDAAGNPYLLGQTLGGSFPVTAGLYANRGGAQFIQKLDADLTASVYSTTFGSGDGADLVPTAFLVDDCERVYVSGWGGLVNDQGGTYLGGSTSGLPITANAVQRTTDGSDFYLAEFRPGLTGLDYATFFGELGGRSGEHVDGGTSRFDKRGIVYQAVCGGCGGSQGFPVPPGANSYTNRNGSENCNNAAFKMDFQAPRADAGPRRALCASAAPVDLPGTPAGGVWSGPGVQRTAAGGYQFVPGVAGPGAFLLTYTVATTGSCVATLRVRYQVAPAVVPDFAPVQAQCASSAAVALTGTPAGGVFSGPGVTGNTFSPQAAGPGTFTLTYRVADSLACGAATQQVVVSTALRAFASPDTTLCADQLRPFQLRGNPGGGTWSGPGVSAAGLFTPPDTQNRGGVFDLVYTVAQPPCQATATRRVVLAPANLTDVPLNLPVCPAAPRYAGLAPFDCSLAPLLPGGTYVWDFGDGSPTSTEATPTHRYAQAGTFRIKLTARYAGCEVLTQFAPLEVGDVFVPNIITANDDSLNATFRPRFSCRPASLKVFSRWGQEVYSTADYHNDWDARGLSAGIYYYLLRDADDRQVKGWVQIVK